MSDSVANLTVKVDVKSVSAAVQALEKLAAAATKVEKVVSGVGKAQGDAAESTKKTASALAAMEKRIDAATRQYDDTIRMIKRANISERERKSALDFTNEAYLKHIKMIRDVKIGTDQLRQTNSAYKNSILDVRDSVRLLEKQENQRIATARKNAREMAAIEKKRVADAVAVEAALQQAQTRVAGIVGRAGRQMSTHGADVVSRQADLALASLTVGLEKYGTRSVESKRLTGEFNREMQRLSGEIARTGGLLPRLSDNARIVSAAFGAANASMRGFSRVLFNTNASLAALTGLLGLREITSSITEFEKFTNTLRTVSNTSGEFQRNLQFLTSEANRIGFSVGEVGNSFARLSLAMKGAGFSGDETRTSFTQLTEAARNFGLSSADTMGVIRALEQSMSKGKFMAEEVRLQLGDRLPIAMAALDKAVTIVDGRQADLNKRFEEGSLDVKRYGTEFIRQINLMSGGAETLARTSNSIAAAFGRLGTEFSLFSNALGEGGLSDAIITFSNSLADMLKTLREIGATDVLGAIFKALGDLVIFVIKSLTELIRFLKNIGALDVLLVFLRTTSAVTQNLSGLTGAANKATESFNDFTRSSTRIKDSISEFDDIMIRNKRTIDASSTAIERRIEANRRLGMSEGEAIAAAARAAQQRNEIELAQAKRSLETAQRQAAAMYQRLIPNRLVGGGVFGSLEQGLAAARAQIATGGIDERSRDIYSAQIKALTEQMAESPFAGAAPVIRDLEKGLVTAEEALNRLNAAYKDMADVPADVKKLMTALAEASVDKEFQKNEIAVRQFREEFARLSEQVQMFADRYSKGINVQITFDIYRQQEGGMPAGAGPSLSEIEQTAFRAISDTQSIPKAAQAVRTALSGLNLKDFANASDLTDKNLIKLARTNDTFRSVLPKVAAELDKVRIAEEGRSAATERSTETLDKYLATLRAQIENQDRIAAAYRISTQAGEDAELQLKAETEAIRLGAKTEEQRIALKKQILPLLQKEAEGEKNVNAAKDLPRMRDEIALLEKERSLLGESLSFREQELAVFRALQQSRGASDEDRAKIENYTRQIVRGRQEIDQFDNSYKEMANIGVRAFEQVGDAITEAFAKGEIRALNFGNVIRGVMSSIVQSILRLGVINPIINSIFSGTMLPTLGAGLSILGGGGAAAAGAAAGAAGGGGGGLSSLLGLGSLTSLLPGGSVGGMFSGVSDYLFGTAPSTTMIPGLLEPGIASGYGGMTTAGTPGLFGTAGSASLGGVLGAGGLGFGAGMFTNSLLGGNQTGGMVGSALGTGAGIAAALALDLALPGVGTLLAVLGGAAGGGIGGLFGPKPSVQGYGFRLQSAGYGPDATPANAMATSLLPISRQFYNESGAAAFQQAEQVVAATNAYLAQRGLLVGGVSVVGGNRFGPDYSWADAGSIEEAFTRLRFGAGSNTELNRVLSGRTFGGLEPLQQFVEGFVSLQDTIKSLTADPVPEFTQQMNALIDSFAQATVKAREYEYGEEELAKARDKQIAKLQEQRNLTIRDTALELEVRRLMAEGMEQEAQRIELAYRTQKEIESFTASLDTLGITAEEKSRLLVELERTQAAERVKVLQDANKNIRDYLDSLRTGALSGTTTVGRLSAAEEIFTRDLALAQAGNVDALNRITQSADTLLNLARETYASTSGFHTLRGRVVSSLEALSAAPASVGLANLSSVPLVSDLMSMRENAAVLETAEYTKQFDSKMAELLPIAQAIQTAVEQTSQVTAAAYGSDTSLGSYGGGGGEGGGGFAMGGVFRYGRVMAYANGGIPDLVNSPTLAPMALFGEAGPEAIMPLRRGPDGRLGVEVNGGGSQAVVAELRAVRNEIINLRGSVEEADSSESGGVVEAIAELRIQIGGLREELRTTRLRAQ